MGYFKHLNCVMEPWEPQVDDIKKHTNRNIDEFYKIMVLKAHRIDYFMWMQIYVIDKRLTAYMNKDIIKCEYLNNFSYLDKLRKKSCFDSLSIISYYTILASPYNLVSVSETFNLIKEYYVKRYYAIPTPLLKFIGVYENENLMKQLYEIVKIDSGVTTDA